MLLNGEDSDAGLSSNIPTFDDLQDDMKLQEYALGFIFKQQIESPTQESGPIDVIDKVVVGCTDPDQVIDDLEVVYQFYARKLAEEQHGE